MVVLLLFAPRSLGGFRSRLPLRLLLWSRLRVVRQVGLPVRSGRDTRGLGCAAAAVVVMARGVAGGSLSFSRASGSLLVARAPFGSFLAFFRGRCESQTPGVGPVGLRVGGRGLCGEMALQKHAGCIISAY